MDTSPLVAAIVHDGTRHTAPHEDALRASADDARLSRAAYGQYCQSYLTYDDRGAIRLALEHHRVRPAAERVEAISQTKVGRFREGGARPPRRRAPAAGPG